MSLARKAINFDLSAADLKKYFNYDVILKYTSKLSTQWRH